jgi:hypothetical protein
VHALLQRQLRRYLDGVDLAAAPWPAFLEAVDRSYLEADIDRNLVETAMEISSHELLQANAELRGLVQAFPDLILHVGADGRITSCRGRATRAFAVPTGGLVGHELRAFFRAGEQAAFDDAMAAARQPGAVVTVGVPADVTATATAPTAAPPIASTRPPNRTSSSRTTASTATRHAAATTAAVARQAAGSETEAGTSNDSSTAATSGPKASAAKKAVSTANAAASARNSPR